MPVRTQKLCSSTKSETSHWPQSTVLDAGLARQIANQAHDSAPLATGEHETQGGCDAVQHVSPTPSVTQSWSHVEPAAPEGAPEGAGPKLEAPPVLQIPFQAQDKIARPVPMIAKGVHAGRYNAHAAEVEVALSIGDIERDEIPRTRQDLNKLFTMNIVVPPTEKERTIKKRRLQKVKADLPSKLKYLEDSTVTDEGIIKGEAYKLKPTKAPQIKDDGSTGSKKLHVFFHFINLFMGSGKDGGRANQCTFTVRFQTSAGWCDVDFRVEKQTSPRATPQAQLDLSRLSPGDKRKVQELYDRLLNSQSGEGADAPPSRRARPDEHTGGAGAPGSSFGSRLAGTEPTHTSGGGGTESAQFRSLVTAQAQQPPAYPSVAAPAQQPAYCPAYRSLSAPAPALARAEMSLSECAAKLTPNRMMILNEAIDRLSRPQDGCN